MHLFFFLFEDTTDKASDVIIQRYHAFLQENDSRIKKMRIALSFCMFCFCTLNVSNLDFGAGFVQGH